MTALRWLTFACSLSCMATVACERGKPTTPSDAIERTEQTAQKTEIRGRLRGVGGKPLARAEVHVEVPGQPAFTVVAGSDGSFAFELPNASWAELRLTGVDHEEYTVTLLTEPGEFTIDAELGTYVRQLALDSVRGVGRFDGNGAAINLVFHPRDDGSWAAQVARGEAGQRAERLYYQLTNVTTEGRTINGTQADAWAYDGGGDYFSVVELGEVETVELVWNPEVLPPSGRPIELSFTPARSFLPRSARITAAIENERRNSMRSAQEAARADGADRERVFDRAEAQLRELFAGFAARETEPALAALWWVGWLGTLQPDASASERAKLAKQVEQVLDEVGPRDPVWSMDDGWPLATALRYVDDPQFFALAVAEHPDPKVGAALWVSTLMAADEAGDLERGREALQALADPRFAELEVAGVAAMYSPDRPTAPGRSVPEFRVRSADGATEYTAESMRGQTYVLDFWATWCGPCVAEMPRLHAAYTQLNADTAGADPRVQILSISFDHDLALVQKFREQWPMPWAHAVPDVATHKQLTESFGIFGIPTMVLVGPDGVILASSPRLDGGSLGEIAERAMDSVHTQR